MPEHRDRRRRRRRKLKDLVLRRIDRVSEGDNPGAKVLLAKRREAAEKTVVSFQDLPLASRERQWDGDAAERRVRRWAGGPDKDDVDFERYRRAFLWFDSDDADNFGAYKLGIADVIDGTLTAVPRGIFAAAAAVEGARGGVDIPQGDMDSVRNHLGRYYRKMRERFDDDSLTAPWQVERSRFPTTKPTVPSSSNQGDSPMAEKDDKSQIDKESLPDDVREYVDELEKRAEASDTGNGDGDGGDEKVADLEKQLADANERIEAFKTEKAEFEKATGSRPAIARDDLPEDVRKELDEADRVRDEVEKIRDERDLERTVAKARDWSNVGQPDTVGGLVHRLAKVAEPKDVEELESVLKAAHERIDSTVLFSEKGARDAMDLGDTASEIDKKAEAIRKDNPELTREQAKLRALDANPELGSQYRAEQRS